MLEAPDHSVVGTNELSIAEKFFSDFGMVVSSREELSASASKIIYGLDGPRMQVMMRTPGAIPGIRLVETPHKTPVRDPLDTQGYTIDIYTRKMSDAVQYVESKGYQALPLARWELDGKSVEECRVLGPEGLSLVLIDGDIKRANIMDKDATRNFSEIGAFVHLVHNANLDKDFWTKRGGLTELRNATFAGTPMVNMMNLPGPGLEMRFALYWQGVDAVSTAKVELVSCELSPEGPLIPLLPLGAEFGPVAFTLNSPGARAFAQEMLDEIEHTAFIQANLEGEMRQVVRAVSPAGVAFELWCREN